MTAATLPPYNEDAEERVLSACLQHPAVLERLAERLHPHHLYIGNHQRIYQAALTLLQRGDPPEPLLVREELARTGDTQAAEHVAHIVALGHASANADHFASLVLDYHARRELVRVGQEIARSGWEPHGAIADELDKAERLVYDLTLQQQPGELQHVSVGLPDTFERLSRPGGEVTGTPTGLAGLDRLTAGYQPGQLVIAAARPSMGKSALAITQAIHVAVHKQQPVALFTLEMSREEINERALAQLAGVNLHRIRTRIGLTERDRVDLDTSRRLLEQAPLYIDDTSSARLTEIRSRARRLKAQEPRLALIAVDYLQLMLAEDQAQNRNLELAGISRGLKVIARELDVPVVALSQLSRSLEYRHDKRPVLSDLRDSGALEQDADLVVFIYRDGYYNKDDEDATAELIVSKHRNGPTGAATVQWEKDTAEFRNLHPGAR